MHLVAQRGQLDAQLRGHHARAAVGGIAGNANAHDFLVLWVGLLRPSLSWTLRAAGKMQPFGLANH